MSQLLQDIRGLIYMSRIYEAFKDKKAFIPFITGGDPCLGATEQFIYAMEKAGADLIEIGVPFSDPVAEGVVIQEANERALLAGTTTDLLFNTIKKTREKVKIPMVFLTYLNPIYTYGTERFMKRCQECGIDGVIVPDMPYEEKGEIKDICAAYGIEIISLIAPTSHERIHMIAKDATGFIYCVSSLGVTGVRSNIQTNLSKMIEEVRSVTQVPCAVGFGIATAEQAYEVAKVADGAIVGSAIVKLVEQYGEQATEAIYKYVREMKKAVERAERA